jgi:hypothetical protein
MNANQPQTQMKRKLNDLKIETAKIISSQTKITIINDEEEEEAYRSPSADVDTPRVWIEADMEYIENVLILLDWDDTLFPTTSIVGILKNSDKNGFALVCDDDIELLNTLGATTLNLLTHLIDTYGANNIHIVTNSLQGWIKDSLQFAACISKIYKQIQALLYTNNITMDSAQSIHGHKENSTPVMWKQLCFESILYQKKSYASYSHVVSIGDQWTDHHSVKQSMHALNITASSTLTARAPIHHIIKLKMTPNLSDMINEILYVSTCFSQIFDVISDENCPYFGNPVIVDYHDEEIKYLKILKK